MQHLHFEVMTLSGFCIEFHRLGLRISGFQLRHTQIPSIRSSGINLVCKVLGLSPFGIHPSLPPEGMIDGWWVYYFLRPLNYLFHLQLYTLAYFLPWLLFLFFGKLMFCEAEKIRDSVNVDNDIGFMHFALTPFSIPKLPSTSL